METEKNRVIEELEIPAERYAAIYARKSTLLENNSLDTQEELAKKKIREHNLVLYDVYKDEESATKYTPFHRPGFKRLLCDAYNGRFKSIIVFRRDRLARKVDDLLEIRRILRKLGIKIIYSNNGEFQPEEDNYISNFIESIIISIDELEPSILAQRVRAGKQQKKERNQFDASIAPFGLEKNNNKDAQFEYSKKDPEWKIVEEIYDRFLHPNDYEDLVQVPNNPRSKRNDLISKIAYCINGKYSKFFKRDKTATDIEKHIVNPIYASRMLKNNSISPIKEVYENNLSINEDLYIEAKNVESIISFDDWCESYIKYIKLCNARDALVADEQHYIFKGLINCKECKSSVVLKAGFYQCKNKCTFLPKDKIEYKILRMIVMNILSKDHLKAYQEEQYKYIGDKLDQIEREIEDINNKQQEEITRIINKFNNNRGFDIRELGPLLKEEQEKKDKIEKEKIKETTIQKLLIIEKLDEIKHSSTISSAVMKLRKNPEYSNYLLKEIIKKIKIKGKKMEDLDEQCEEIKFKQHTT
jgi:site-specific DNA recombinase